MLTEGQQARAPNTGYGEAVADEFKPDLSALTVWACLTLKLLSLFILKLATELDNAFYMSFQRWVQ